MTLILTEKAISFVSHLYAFAISFGGAYDIEDLTSSPVGDCQAPHIAVDGRG